MYKKSFKNLAHDYNLKGGFTLVETFVAITILLITVLGPLSLVAKFYADNTYAKNQVAAAFLAQDGLETAVNILRNGRLKYYAANPGGCVVENLSSIPDSDWMGGLETCISDEGCDVDSITQRVESTTGPGEDGYQLEKDSDGFYRAAANGTLPTYYFRLINVEVERLDSATNPNSDFRSVNLTSKVTWRYKGAARTMEISTKVIQNICF